MCDSPGLFFLGGHATKPGMSPDTLKSKLETLAPNTEALIMDMTGTQDHYQAVVVSPVFQGKLTIDRHRMVLDLVQKDIDSGEIHALTLKTYTPEQYAKL